LAHQSENLTAAAVKTWLDEGQAFFADKARDDAQALQQLQSCKTPLDVISVEQRWIACRAQAYIDAGFRMITGACLQPEQAAAEAAGFRLPD